MIKHCTAKTLQQRRQFAADSIQKKKIGANIAESVDRADSVVLVLSVTASDSDSPGS